ncbi:unnamed protein product [Dicrocoelium dendriticum]|nr:unnamed protein product [Dicrocoelium dendriticum]
MPSCNRHCYLFTVDQGEVVLLHAPNTPSQRLIPITADAYSRLDTLAGVSNAPDAQGIILPNGRVRHGSQLNVSCHSGFELAGSQPSTTTCTDGVWSFRIKCIPASCRTRPPAARGARVRFYSLQHNSRARYECFAGRQLRVEKALRMSALMTPPDTVRDPLGTVRCLHGHWMGTPVYCEPITCPELTVEKGIRVELKRIGAEGHNDVARPTHGTLAIFRCPPGFHITGTPYSVCQVGNWTPPVNPKCTETTHLVIPTEWLFRRP